VSEEILELSSEQEAELDKTVEMILKSMLVTMAKHADHNNWQVELKGRSDWDVLCWTIAAGAMQDVTGHTVTTSEDGYSQTWSVDGRVLGGAS